MSFGNEINSINWNTSEANSPEQLFKSFKFVTESTYWDVFFRPLRRTAADLWNICSLRNPLQNFTHAAITTTGLTLGGLLPHVLWPAFGDWSANIVDALFTSNVELGPVLYGFLQVLIGMWVLGQLASKVADLIIGGCNKIIYGDSEYFFTERELTKVAKKLVELKQVNEEEKQYEIVRIKERLRLFAGQCIRHVREDKTDFKDVCLALLENLKRAEVGLYLSKAESIQIIFKELDERQKNLVNFYNSLSINRNNNADSDLENVGAEGYEIDMHNLPQQPEIEPKTISYCRCLHDNKSKEANKELHKILSENTDSLQKMRLSPAF